MASHQRPESRSLESPLQEDLYDVIERQVQKWEDLSRHNDDGVEEYTPRTDLDYLKAALLLPQAIDDLILMVARRAHSSGHTWGEIAEAAGLSSAQIAHHRWAEGRERRLESLKKRVTGRRPSMATPDVPGRSAAEAARLLGCDVRTLPGKAASGEIQARQVKLNSGITRTRYFLPGDPMPA